MEGVWVNVDCGFERRRRADRAQTDKDGRYELQFEPAMVVADADPYGVGIQPAFVSVQKPGFYDTSLRHRGNLALAGKPPEPDQQRFVADRAGVVLVNEPYELDFAMAPAARLEGQLVDAQGEPLARQSLGLLSPRMYPPNVGFTTVRTDATGRFLVENLPCTSFRFSCFQPPVAHSQDIAFARPGTWQLTLKYRETGPQRAELLVMDLQEPTPTKISGRVLDPNGNPAPGA
jgi:hypothetical protein